MTKEQKEQLARAKKKFGKNDKSLSILIQESDLYDWNPTARMTLLVIALGQRTSEEAYFPEDCPYEKEDMLGWCDMAQWRLALRVGISVDWIQKVIKKLEEDGVLEVRRREDDNHANHDMYRVIEKTVKERQRPKQSPDVVRGKRYKKERHANRGSFTTANQPGKNREIYEMDEVEA